MRAGIGQTCTWACSAGIAGPMSTTTSRPSTRAIPFEALVDKIRDAGVPQPGIEAIAAAVVDWTSYRVPHEIWARAERQLEDARVLLAFANERPAAFDRFCGFPPLATHYRQLQETIVSRADLRARHQQLGKHTLRPGVVQIGHLALPFAHWAELPTDCDMLLVISVLMLDALEVRREARRGDGNGYGIADRVLQVAGLRDDHVRDTKRVFRGAQRKLDDALERSGYPNPAGLVLKPARVLDGYRHQAQSLRGTSWEPDTQPGWAEGAT